MADSAKPKDQTIKIPPNLKTWVLKTSIHCEGCKKKVIKILHNTPGVYDSDVDLKLQKVLVTGNIDVNALIAKLIKKTGKHAELWPEIITEQQPQKKQSKPKPKLKQPPVDAQKVHETPAVDVTKKIIRDDEILKKKAPETKTSGVGPQVQKMEEEVNLKENESDKPSTVEIVKLQPNQKEEDSASKETEKVEKETEEAQTNATADGGAAAEKEDGGVGKKKKKKGQNRKQNPDPRVVEDLCTRDATGINEQSFQNDTTNQTRTRQYPAHMYGPSGSYHAPPVYTVSYNTTPYPTSSYGASYYATPPPHTESYAYSGSSSAQYQPSDYVSYQSHHSDSFLIFSDENPNACSLM